MTQSNWVSLAIAVIGVLSAWLASRAAQNAAKYSARSEAETEAYNRARKMDIETIERQDKEIDEIRQNNQDLRQKIRTLITANERLNNEIQKEREDNETLRRRVTRLEQQLGEHNG